MYTFLRPLHLRTVRKQRHHGPQRIRAAVDVEEAEDGPGEDLLLPHEDVAGRTAAARKTDPALVESPSIAEGREISSLNVRAGEDPSASG
nr:hypothetical protein [Methanoculleus marisnigri]